MLTKPTTVEDYVLMCLKKGPLEKAQLIKQIMKLRQKTALQSIYQELRKLKKLEIIVIRKNIVSLSSMWVHDMMHYFHNAQIALKATILPYENYQNLREGEKISYTFQTAEQLDMFWGHIFLLMNQTTPANEFSLLFHPHEWFFIARNDSEEKLYHDLSTHKRSSYVITNNCEPLDIEISKKYTRGSLQWHTTNDSFLWDKHNYYLSSFGNILIEGWIDKKIATLINTFFKNHTTIETSNITELRKIIALKGKHKLIISRNKARVKKITSWFKKYFLIK